LNRFCFLSSAKYLLVVMAQDPNVKDLKARKEG